MAVLNSSVGLIYTIGADASGAEKEVSKFSKTVDKETDSSSNSFANLGASIGLTDSQIAGLGKSLPVLGSIAAGIAGIATAAATMAIGTGVALFGLVKQTAEVGTEIANFQKLTGLTAASISTIKVASESAGTSLEEFEEVWESFIEVLLEGGKGADDAKEKLKAAGIDPQKGFKDLNGSVEKAFDAIRKAETQAEKSAIAMKIFGESGLSMVKVADEMTGGFDAYSKKLKEMGLATDEQGIKKAKEFDRQLKETNSQIAGVGKTIAMEFMPIFLDMAKSTSAFFRENKDDVASWARTSSDFIRGLIVYWGQLQTAVEKYNNYYNSLTPNQQAGQSAANNYVGYVASPIGYGIYQAAKYTTGVGAQQRQSNQSIGDLRRNDDTNINPATPFTPVDAEKQKAAADTKKAEAEKAASEQLAAQAKLNQAIAEGNRAAFEQLQKNLIESYKERGITAEKFNNEFLESERNFRVKMLDVIEKEFDQKRSQEKNATAKKALDIEERNAKEKLIQESTERETQAEKLITETEKQESEKRSRQTEEEANRKIALHKSWTEAALAETETMFRKMLIDEETYIRQSQALRLRGMEGEKLQLSWLEQTADVKQKIAEIDAQINIQRNEDEREWYEYYDKVIDREIEKIERKLELEKKLNEERERQNELLAATPPQEGDINPETNDGFSDAFSGEDSVLFDGISQSGEILQDFGNVWQELGNIANGVLKSMAQGIGNMVQNLVLLGNTGGQSFRKLVASVLAGVSAQAATMAVMETAYGIAALTPWGAAIYGPAPLHFKAAALFGAIAVGAGVIGRVAAGDAFKNESSAGAVTNGGSSNDSNNRNGARAFSGFGDEVRTVNVDQNDSSSRGMFSGSIRVGLDSDGVLTMLEKNVRSNGRFRNLILDVMEER